jgi:hypothetical protein
MYNFNLYNMFIMFNIYIMISICNNNIYIILFSYRLHVFIFRNKSFLPFQDLTTDNTEAVKFKLAVVNFIITFCCYSGE